MMLHPSQPDWIINRERLSDDVKEFAKKIELIARKIIENGEVTISGNKIRFPHKCRTLLRFERLPRGELNLKIEITWSPNESSDKNGEEELVIE